MTKCPRCKDKRIIVYTYGSAGACPVSCDHCKGVTEEELERFKRGLREPEQRDMFGEVGR